MTNLERSLSFLPQLDALYSPSWPWAPRRAVAYLEPVSSPAPIQCSPAHLGACYIACAEQVFYKELLFLGSGGGGHCSIVLISLFIIIFENQNIVYMQYYIGFQLTT